MPRLAFTLGILMLAASAQAQVYRCTNEAGTLIFSDRPCSDTAEVHHSSASFSVVPGPADVQERQAENRAFIDQQREHRQAQRLERQLQASAAAGPERREPGPVARPAMQFVPIWAQAPAAPPDRPRPPEAGRPERGERGFSALSGRQPGSARRDQDDLPRGQ